MFFLGWLYDSIGSYDVGFYFAGTMITISGVMLFGIPWIKPKRLNFPIEGDLESPTDKIAEEDEEGWDDAPPMSMRA